MMHYQIQLPQPNNHLFNVKLSFSGNGCERNLTLPNWIRGSYMIRDFSRNIVSISASEDLNPLHLEKLNKSNWKVPACSGEIEVCYQVYAFDLSVRSAHMDNTHAFFNGTSLYLAVDDLKSLPIKILIVNPELPETSNWTVKTSLNPKSLDDQGFGYFIAENYEEAIDHPVEISQSHDLAFNVGNVPHLIHFTGDFPDPLDDRRLALDLKRICSEQAALFDHDIPFESYRFLTMVAANSYGGLEHRSSTALVCMPEDLPTPFAIDEKNYQKFLGLCSHEYFHSWNVKRITPANFASSNLQNEAYSSLLWAFEGITSYYDDLALLRCGCIELKTYLDMLAQTLTRLQRSKGRLVQSVADSSFDAWTKFYKQDENALNAIVSYYTKGAVIALGLDLEIRRLSKNAISLDHVMRAIWNEFGSSPKGVEEQQLETFIIDKTQLDLSEFFELTLRSVEELPVAEWLAYLGVGLTVRPEKSSLDIGGFSDTSKVDTSATTSMTLGCRLKAESTEIMAVYNDSPTEKAGICPGDHILAIDNKKITPKNYSKIVDNLSSEYPVNLHFFRRERLYQAQILACHQEANTCDLYLIDDDCLSSEQKTNRSLWMQSNQNKNL